MKISDARTLFPEAHSDDELIALLRSVSNIDLADVQESPDRLDEYADIPRATHSADTHATKDLSAFSRALCRPSRMQLGEMLDKNILTKGNLALKASLEVSLVEVAQDIVTRTLVATMASLSDRGYLQGETPTARFADFCEVSSTAAFVEKTLDIFPELRRQVDVAVSGYVRNAELMLERTLRAVRDGSLDWTSLGPTPFLSAVSGAAGDAHAGGQAVAVLTFSNGHKVVYKPRPMDTEAAYYDLLAWFNSNAGTEFSILKVVARESYGWQEFADSVRTPDSDAYYRHSGELLAVLHLLRATDMHYENVLNHLGFPAVVDAETLFSVNERVGGDTGGTPSHLALADSVHSTGFLPSRIFSGSDFSQSIDVGFLGYRPGQEAITGSHVVKNLGTDQAYIEMVVGTVDAETVLPPDRVSSGNIDNLCGGFGSLYDWVSAHSTEVGAEITRLFTSVPVRIVVENTRKYYQLLRLITHPVFQESALLTKVVLHRCGLGRDEHVTTAVVRAEIDALLARDIPYFTLRTDSTWIYGPDATRLSNVLIRTPLQRVLSGIESMSGISRDLNLNIIHADFIDKMSPDDDRPQVATEPKVRPTSGTRRHITTDAAKSIATEIADSFCRFAQHDASGQSATGWIGATIYDATRPNPWTTSELGDDLYGGRPGVALFLAAAGKYLDCREYIELAESYLLPASELLLSNPDTRRARMDGGVASGYAGLAYTLVQGGALLADSGWIDRGLSLWASIGDDLPLLSDGDFLMGSAGILTASIGMLPNFDPTNDVVKNVLRPTADKAFDHLMAFASRATIGFEREPYSGFAHGTSGLIAALAAYSSISPRAIGPLDEARMMHARFYRESEGYWAVGQDNGNRPAHGWCHGTPGILLGQSLEMGSSGKVKELDALVATVKNEAFNLNYSMCHGDLGNLLILQEVAARHGLPKLRSWVSRASWSLTTSMSRRLKTHRGKSFCSDSLLVGRSGIGYSAIQLSGELELPSVLRFGSAMGVAG